MRLTPSADRGSGPDWPCQLGTNGGICTYGEILEEWVVWGRAPRVAGGQSDGKLTRHLGGCAANVAVSCVKSGVAARMVGHAGADRTGRYLASALRGMRVDVDVRIVGRSARSLCLIDEVGDRSLIFDPGDSRKTLSVPPPAAWTDRASLVHMNSHHLYSRETAPAAIQMLRAAQRDGIACSLDVSAVSGLLEYGVDRYLALLKSVRPALLFCNGAEAGVLGLDISGSEVVARTDGVVRTLAEDVGTAIVHRGRHPSAIIASCHTAMVDVTEPSQLALDATGAGDAFAGGVLAGWRRGMSILDSVQLGHRRSSETILHAGSHPEIE